MRAIYGVLLIGFLGIACSSTSSVSREESSDRPVVRGFAAVECTATGMSAGTISGKVDTVDYRGKKYLVRRTPIFTEQQVKTVRKNPAQAEAAEFGLDESGTEALRVFSSDRSNIDHPVAFRFGERWVCFPILQSTIPNGTFILIGLTEEEFGQAEKAFGAR